MSLRFAFLVLGSLAVAWASSPCAAADKADVKTVRLEITPATEPLPALKYQLLPRFADRRPGNAAVRYERIALHHRADEKIDKEVGDWLQLPFAEFRKPEMLAKVEAAGTDKHFDDLQLAALLENCSWELPYREQLFFAILIPEVQELRRFGRYLSLKARREIAVGKFDQAVTTLQVGYAMARHTGQGATLIHGLVATSIASMLDQVLLDFAQSPGAPSLYWALSFQPRPFIDPRTGFEAEMDALFMSFPELKSIDPEKPSEVDAVAALNKLTSRADFVNDMVGGSSTTAVVGKMLGTTALLAYTAVRRDELQKYLVTCGWKPKRAEKLNEAELLLAYTRAKYEELRDQSFRWMNLPYWQARPGLAAADRRVKEAAQNREELMPYGALLLPAVGAVTHTYARSERRIDVLRVIEALRLYAGKHDGKLPKSLTELTDVPVPPLDLITGKPFDYALANDGSARLTLSEELLGSGPHTVIYEISVAAKK